MLVFLPLSLSESSDQLVYPHAKLARRWHLALPHTDGIYLTLTELFCLYFTLLYSTVILLYVTAAQRAPFQTSHMSKSHPLEVSEQSEVKSWQWTEISGEGHFSSGTCL